MDKDASRNCILCKEFVLEAATPAWSEVTPGDPAELRCGKRLWEAERVTERWIREYMHRAETCEHYSHYKGEERRE